MKPLSYRMILLLQFTAAEIFARAGSGSGGGGGSGSAGGSSGYRNIYNHSSSGGSGISGSQATIVLFWGIIVVLAGLGIVLFFAWLRAGNTRRILLEAQAEDEIWNVKKMKALTTELFHDMQQAWTRQDLSSVRDRITPKLLRQYELLLADQKAQKIRNMSGDVKLLKMRIIDVEDQRDNEADRFAIFIEGTMSDYMVSYSKGQALRSGNPEPEPFTDTWHFHRHGKQWLLDEINNEPGYFDRKTASAIEDEEI